MNHSTGSTVVPAGQVAVLRAPVTIPGGNFFTAKSSTASLCPGDSGSGFMTLREGLNVVTGIVSQASIATTCTTETNLEFDSVDVFQHLDWIISTTSGMGPALPPRNTIPADVVNADYDGDGKVDLAVKTAWGDWKIDFASNGFGFWDVIYSGYGGPDAHAVPADYDGDHKADLSVKSDGGVWYIDYAANGFGRWDAAYSGYGWSDAHPVPADYDADGNADLSVKTDGGVWYLDYAGDGFGVWNASYSGYGFSDAHPIPADYDGDRKFDLSVKTDSGSWFIDYAASGSRLGSISPLTSFGVFNASYSGWGNASFRPVPGDYDGDRRSDLAVYNSLNNSYQIDFSSDGFGGIRVTVIEAP